MTTCKSETTVQMKKIFFNSGGRTAIFQFRKCIFIPNVLCSALGKFIK